MKYMLLIYQNEAAFEKMKDAEKGAIHQEYGPFTEGIIKSGNFQAGNGLKPTSTATTVKIRNGKRVVTDGPFAETKEQLAGYYLIEVKDIDEAITIAARIPSARIGSVEVRPIIEQK
jgi:hypothetical protein